MATKQGSVALLNDPVAQKLLQSKIPARLAYTWSDGTPRVVPVWFHWDGRQVVLASPLEVPKARVLKTGTPIALTVDTEQFPAKVLLIRGTAEVSQVDGMAPEQKLAAERYLGPEAGQAFVLQTGQLIPQWWRIAVTPKWVGILDFETRLPSAVEKALAKAAGKAAGE